MRVWPARLNCCIIHQAQKSADGDCKLGVETLQDSSLSSKKSVSKLVYNMQGRIVFNFQIPCRYQENTGPSLSLPNYDFHRETTEIEWWQILSSLVHSSLIVHCSYRLKFLMLKVTRRIASFPIAIFIVSFGSIMFKQHDDILSHDSPPPQNM